MDITEIQDELFRMEYPNLLPGHDPDIERYYYLRSNGYAADALVLYQNRLKPRYPDDEFRTWLLRSYRNRDPVFNALLARAYRLIGARSMERIKKIILLIAQRVELMDEKDAYSTIKTAEDILRYLPKERYEAIAGIDRFTRYAEALKLKEQSLTKASELVRAYLTKSIAIVENERRRRSEAQRQAREQEEKRLIKADYENYLFQRKYGYKTALVDFSSIVFSPADLARIEIPPFKRIEDQVLAYCVKYWNLVNDPSIERILFLYSRKFAKKNHDVYMIIRRGRIAGYRDDEILSAIVSLLITGYYYSVQGDLYLQRSWRAIKSKLKEQPVRAMPSGNAAITNKQKALRRKKAVQRAAVVVTKPKTAAPQIAVPKTAVPKTAVPKTAVPKTAVPKTAVPKTAVPKTAVKKAPPEHKQAQQAARIPVKPKTQSAAPIVQPPPPPEPRKQTAFNTSLEKAKGSVSDRLKQLSGHSYDVYQDRFLAKARGSIRKVMERGKGLFFKMAEEAEDIVYGFLRDHYADPYMNWEDSAERKKLSSMGYDLPSLTPVIDECYHAL